MKPGPARGRNPRRAASGDPATPAGQAPAPGALTEAIDGFSGSLELERGLSRHTVAAYESDLRQCAGFLARRGVRDWTEAEPAQLTDWIYSLSEEDFAVSSLARKLT